MLAGLVVLGILLAFIVLSRRTPEPIHEGKTLSQWLLLLDSQTEHKAENDAAAKALSQMRERALPGLIRILDKREYPPLVRKARSWAMRWHLLRPDALALGEWQYRAARACCILGGWNDVDIRAAVPELAYHLTNTAYLQEPFAWALVYSGSEGLFVVTNAMAHAASPRVREEAARSLWISPRVRTPEVTRALMSATRDSDSSVRVTAILALRSFARQDDLRVLILPGALRCLEDTNGQVRLWSIELLGDCGSAPGVESALTRMLKDTDPAVQEEAEKALARHR